MIYTCMWCVYDVQARAGLALCHGCQCFFRGGATKACWECVDQKNCHDFM